MEEVTKQLEETEEIEQSPSQSNAEVGDVIVCLIQLPAFWRQKETPTGQIYYYNTQTNQTTYDINQVRQTVCFFYFFVFLLGTYILGKYQKTTKFVVER